MPSTSPRSPRAERHAAIRKLIARQRIRSQAELADLLEDGGLGANQATLSRDLRELGVRKGPDGYELPPGAGHAPDALSRAVGEFLNEAVPVAHEVVLRTPPSGAQPLALAIDQSRTPGVVGTVAGDDTVLVICESPRAATRLAKNLLAARPSR
jgi:transcriptional regulator of arginine metabolism